jgi:hypothetical protein
MPSYAHMSTRGVPRVWRYGDDKVLWWISEDGSQSRVQAGRDVLTQVDEMVL